MAEAATYTFRRKPPPDWWGKAGWMSWLYRRKHSDVDVSPGAGGRWRPFNASTRDVDLATRHADEVVVYLVCENGARDAMVLEEFWLTFEPLPPDLVLTV